MEFLSLRLFFGGFTSADLGEAAISGSVYVPIESYELLHGAGWLSLGALMVTVFIVGSMFNALLRQHWRERRLLAT